MWKWSAALTASFGALVLAAVFSFRDDLSPSECEALEARKNLALAHLENPPGRQQLAEADALFESIARRLPGDPLPLRNLAITRFLELVSAPDDGRPLAAARAKLAAERLLKLDGDSAVPHLLAGKIYHAARDEPRAMSEISRATELAPLAPAIWYDLYRLQKDSDDAAVRQQAGSALARAFEAAPGNLVVQIASLETQASAHDAAIRETLARLKSTLATMPGLIANIDQRSHGAIADALVEIDQISQAAAAGDWPDVIRRTRRLANMIKAENWTKSDLRRIERHPLEYVLHDFDTRCPSPAHPGGPADAHTLAVRLVEFPADARLASDMPGIDDLELADFDLDGRLDAIVLRAGKVEVYSRGAKQAWRRIAERELPPGITHLLVADFDRDDPQQPGTAAHDLALRRQPKAKRGSPIRGRPADADDADASPTVCHRADLDIAAYGTAGIVLLRNDLADEGEERSLSIVPQNDALTRLSGIRTMLAADIYHDGDLDLVLAADDGLHLWSNRGNLTFTDITAASQLPPASLRPTTLVAVDWDRDVDLDVLVAGPGGEPAGYLENLRHAQFRWRPFESGFEALKSARAFALVDSETGSWNLAVAGEPGISLVRTETSHAGLVSQQSAQQLSPSPRGALVAWDLDNDGYQDLLAWNGNSIDFFRGDEAGNFAALPPLLPAQPQQVRACRVGDIDGDGDEDLAIAGADRIWLYSNEGGNRNHWLNIELRAGVADVGEGQTASYRSNHYGRGSLLDLRSGSHRQRRIVNGATTHFGLGEREAADLLRVVWTTGIPQDLTEPQADTVICDEQILGGSCPYLYTWDGEKFAFCTDCLWAAPLGLQAAEGLLAPSRSWEYLRIGGDQLAASEGEYRLRITEELWEAAYLDEVRLIAVDHPADVKVYSNEKVGPAELAQKQVHTVRSPLPPVAARDQQGRDVLERIRHRDGRYVKPFDRRLAFGYTEDHYIELDFGRHEERRATLFLTGWIRPTGTSMNVALSQDPTLPAPRAPSLWTPDASGQWREVRAFTGYPGGKTKTIAIDLTDAFAGDDHRLRIATNMEIYWDEAFITLDEAPESVRLTPLRLTSADLHYRGFSLRTPDEEFGPEHFDYDRVSTAARWPAMRGRFTRYGAVDELVDETDDRLAILGAGDELSLTFALPDATPPPGWRRDFLLYNVGWDKDGDLNTVYGDSVEPLPFGAMNGYPYGGQSDYPDSERLRRYLHEYQTRTQDYVLP
jgi:hypothetical protein